MPAVRRGPLLSFFWRLHKKILRITGGRLASRVDGFPVLILHTVGRKSGQPRTNSLAYVPYGEAYVVVGTNAGADFDPEWVLNLRSLRKTEITVAGKTTKVSARESKEEERHTLFQKFIDTSSAHAEYQRRTKREIPVIVLEPVK